MGRGAQAEQAKINAYSCLYGAVIRVLFVAGEDNLLAIILVLLLAPLDAHAVGVVDCHVADIGIGELTFLWAKEGEVVPGEGE